MISVIALWLAALNPSAEVRTLSVVPADNRTEVVIRVAGDVKVKHSFLREGNRLVLDLSGAQQGLRLDFDVNRGGVVGLRVGQFQPQIVRVVVDLAQPVQYEVNRAPGEIRVSFPNPGATFEAWTTGINDKAPQVAAAAAEMRAPAAQPPVRPQPEPQVQVQPRRESVAQQQEAPLTFTFVDQPIIDMLALFSEVSGRSIVAAPEVQAKTISAEIRDKPWDLALAAILAANGMIVNESEGGILTVELQETVNGRSKTEPLVTQEYRINYMSADSLVTTVQSLLTAAGKVAVNPSGNSLLVTDTRSTITRISPIIQQLDVQAPQVSIAAKIVFVDRTALEELGFVYDLKDSRGNQLNSVIPGFLDANNNGILEPDEQTDNNVVLLGGNSVAALGNANYRVAKPALQVLGSLVLGRHSLFSFIEALKEVSVSDVQAAPVITTLANREARIQVGERTPIRVVDAAAGGGAGGGNNAPRASVRTEQTGIILRVTPMITGNLVNLEIHAERSNIGLAPADIGATFNTQEADTQVMVENGETAVIGGLTLIEKLKVRAGIPILMDIPVLGRLFRTETTREQKRDLLIMVTPHIIR